MKFCRIEFYLPIQKPNPKFISQNFHFETANKKIQSQMPSGDRFTRSPFNFLTTSRCVCVATGLDNNPPIQLSGKSLHQQFACFLASGKWILCGGMNGSILETIIRREKSKHGGGGHQFQPTLDLPLLSYQRDLYKRQGGDRLLEAATVLGDGRVQGKKRLTGVLEIFFSGGWFGLRIKW